MDTRFIKNFDELSITENRKIALEIIEAGLQAINTSRVVNSQVSLTGEFLSIQDKEFDLRKFKNIKIVGFGKSSPEAALALESILGPRIKEGAVIGIEKVPARYVEMFAGTHPKPSEENIEAGQRIHDIIHNSTEEDLIIVLVSGGGSALLCYPEKESLQGAKLYENFLKSGKTISEINTVRKHMSLLKGGGLAKMAYPATIIGLIFSDVPGDNFFNVASGPTYKDVSTLEDAKKIVEENNLGDFGLIETPKEDKYFEKVHNFVLVSNKTALKFMREKAEEYGFYVNTVSADLYDEASLALRKIFSAVSSGDGNCAVLVAGEPSVVVPSVRGKGGRNLHMALLAINMDLCGGKHIFISFASDGMDNSDAGGAIVDSTTIKKIKDLGLNASDYLNRFDSYSLFEKTGDLIMTGSTGANVSDIMILLNKK